MSDPITPFTIDIPESQLDDLRQRLALTRWPEAETTDDWSQGVPLGYAREMADYWRTDYDWRRCENLLRRWPHYITNIDDRRAFRNVVVMFCVALSAVNTMVCMYRGSPIRSRRTGVAIVTLGTDFCSLRPLHAFETENQSGLFSTRL